MLNRKTVFITGSNRGIGKAILEEFAAADFDIIAHARNETPAFVASIQEVVNKYGVKIDPIYFDFLNQEDVKQKLKKLYLSKKQVDVLVNSAGAYYADMYSQTSIDKAREIMEIDFFAPYQITQIILKIMTRQRCGSIINISSIAGIDMTPRTIAYSCAKAAVVAFTKTIAAEYGQFGIRCNAIAPGLVDTDMIKSHSKEELEYFEKLTTLKRVGLPSDVAKTIRFLASDDASFINGQIIRVDGGIK